jgi:Flp pilus assembly pilin Flp
LICWLDRFKFAGSTEHRKKDLFMQAPLSRFGRSESGVTAIGYSLDDAAALMLIGVVAWIVATAHHVTASTQAGVDPLQMMAIEL